MPMKRRIELFVMPACGEQDSTHNGILVYMPAFMRVHVCPDHNVHIFGLIAQ